MSSTRAYRHAEHPDHLLPGHRMSDSAATLPAPWSPGAELLATTTYKLIRPFEATALLLQAVNLFASPINDRYQRFGVPVVLALGVAHLALAGLVLRHRGPLTR